MEKRPWTGQKFLGVFSISIRKGPSSKWLEMWPCNIDSNCGKYCCCCWLVKSDRRIASRMIAESLKVPKTVVLRILKKELGKRKLCEYFFPHSLTPEQREDRITSCQDIIAMADADKCFWENCCGRWYLVFCLWPRKKATDFWMGWWDISSAKESEIPKAPHQDYADNFFFRLSSRSAQRIRTRWKNSTCRIL